MISPDQITVKNSDIKSHPAMRLLLCLLTYILVPAEAWGVPQVQEDAALNEEWHRGYELFQMLLEQKGLTAQVSWNESLQNPSESVVVVCGDLRYFPTREWLRMRRFVAQGGALLVASEGSFEIPGVCNFIQGSVVASNAKDRYLSFADCIRIRDINTDDDLLKGINEIVVNQSGWLSKPIDDSLNWEVAASLPATSLPRASRGQPLILVGRDAAPQTGIMILAADQSLFTNGMLWHGDNAILAIQTSELLCGSGRQRLLFVSNGNLLPGYQNSPLTQPPPRESEPISPPNIEPPEPDFETKLRLANAVLDEVQDSNLVNELLRDRPRNMRPMAYLRTAMLILLIAATLFILWRLLQNRRNLPALPRPRFLQSVFGVTSTRQVANSEFGSAIVVLARELCFELTGSRIETDWLKVLSERPTSLVQGLNPSQRQELTELLGLAVRGTSIHLSRKRFQSLGRAIKELRERNRHTPIVVTA